MPFSRCPVVGCPEGREAEHSANMYPPSAIEQSSKKQTARKSMGEFSKQSRDQFTMIKTLEQDVRRITNRFGEREQLLQNLISKLQEELQTETDRFHQKLVNFNSLLNFSSESGQVIYAEPSFQSDVEEDLDVLSIVVERNQEGCFGFKLIDGTSAEPRCGGGVFISSLEHENKPGDTESLRHYDRVLKVNGQALSDASAEEAVNILEKARDPVTVEVLRRMTFDHVTSHVTSATQTEPVTSDDDADCDVTIPLVDNAPSNRNGLLWNNLYSAENGYLERMADEKFMNGLNVECRTQLRELEYEEVVLQRSSSRDRLGLTLCYGAGEDVDTDIFVSEVYPDSIASQDGRIRQGDQILQINGVDVNTRDRAIELFKQDRKTITLLLARTPAETTNEETGDLDISCLSPMPELATAEEEEEEEEDFGALTDVTRGSGGSNHEKDSGISRTTDSEPEMLPPPICSPCGGSSPNGLQEISSASDTYGVSSKFVTAPSALSSPGSEAPTPMYLQGVQLKRSESSGSLEAELACLHREMESVRLECDRLIAQHASAETQVRQQLQTAQCLMATVGSIAKQRRDAAPFAPQAYDKLQATVLPAAGADRRPNNCALTVNGYQRGCPVGEMQCRARNAYHSEQIGASPNATILDETSSAYNTGGESCRSTPLNLDTVSGYGEIETNLALRHFDVVPTTPLMAPIRRKKDTHNMPLPTSKHQDKTLVTIPLKPSTSAPMKNSACQSISPKMATDIMYTNPENLQQTIAMQQRLLRKAMIDQAQKLKTQRPQAMDPPNTGAFCSQQNISQSQESEWKVKRRSDGSRYVTKRPVRNKILKERAQLLTKERCGVTTDDDAFSELKVGRYWSREERKRHMEKTRERKRRQEDLIRRKQMAMQQPADQAIIELSQKKMMRKKGQQLFDKFTTVQEFLAHGNKLVDNPRSLGILSVTTV